MPFRGGTRTVGFAFHWVKKVGHIFKSTVVALFIQKNSFIRESKKSNILHASYKDAK